MLAMLKIICSISVNLIKVMFGFGDSKVLGSMNDCVFPVEQALLVCRFGAL